jgi:hypothetical protein
MLALIRRPAVRIIAVVLIAVTLIKMACSTNGGSGNIRECPSFTVHRPTPHHCLSAPFPFSQFCQL